MVSNRLCATLCSSAYTPAAAPVQNSEEAAILTRSSPLHITDDEYDWTMVLLLALLQTD
jgi:hypothetical protein